MSRSAVEVRVLAAADYPDWNRLVGAAPLGSIYSRPEYLAALGEATGGRFRIVGAHKGKELVGGVALYEHSGRGARVSPRLLLYYNGVVLRPSNSRYPSGRAARELEVVEALADFLDRQRSERLELRSRSPLRDVRPFVARGWRAWPSYTYVVKLADLERQWTLVDQNLRRLVSRCASAGVEVTEDGDFDSYYRLHVQTHERTGAPLYLPYGSYSRLVERLRAAGLCRLYHARLADGCAISSQLVLLGHPVTHTVSAASDAGHLRLGAAAFLRWRVLEDLASLGYEANDLTDATLGSVARFKAQLGGTLELSLVVARRESRLLRAERAARALARRLVRRGGAP
ncbi:MAG: GNAT family N-acetyltransferase [Thermoleophilia bacterium]|nr:GNAT family N-acetyltransferase [Thermoleophilia bacterium]